MDINFLAVLTAALSTLIVGAIYYHPKIFGNAWMRESGLTLEQLQGTNMIRTLALAFIYAFLAAFMLQFLVIHQFGAAAMVGGDPSLAKPSYDAFMTDYGSSFRTFKHGMLHGFMSGLLLALPIIGTNALFEKRSFRYTLITGGYWIVAFTLMGGILSAWQ